MFECWGATASWYLIVDDDTFARPDLLLTAVKGLNADDYHLLGIPTSSDKFAVAAHQARADPKTLCTKRNTCR
eukprot:5374403-Amphidinium_carterae.1